MHLFKSCLKRTVILDGASCDQQGESQQDEGQDYHNNVAVLGLQLNLLGPDQVGYRYLTDSLNVAVEELLLSLDVAAPRSVELHQNLVFGSHLVGREFAVQLRSDLLNLQHRQFLRREQHHTHQPVIGYDFNWRKLNSEAHSKLELRLWIVVLEQHMLVKPIAHDPDIVVGHDSHFRSAHPSGYRLALDVLICVVPVNGNVESEHVQLQHIVNLVVVAGHVQSRLKSLQMRARPI